MPYYQVLVTRKLPVNPLTYSSERELEVGTLVEVSIGKKIHFGVVTQKLKTMPDYDLSKIKSIQKIYSLQFSNKYLQFLKLFSFNTFNSIDTVLAASIQFFKYLSKEDQRNLETKSKPHIIGTNADIPNGNNPKIDYILDKDILVRIIYLIRSKIDNIYSKSLDNKLKKPFQILILFPEKKLLDRFYAEFEKSSGTQEIQKTLNLNLNKFSATNARPSKLAIKSILDSRSSEENSINITFSTRSGLFLPFSNLQEIFLIEEANQMYIQEQNSLYYDAREAVFMLSKVLDVNLTFLSSIPSIRLLEMYPKKSLDELMINYKQNDKKLPKIQITERNRKIDQFSEFSTEVEDILFDS